MFLHEMLKKSGDYRTTHDISAADYMWPAYPKWENPIVGIHYHTARTRLFNFELLSGEKTDFYTGLFPMTYSKIDNPGDVRKITYYSNF